MNLSKKTVGAVGLALVAVLVGCYFAFLSSKSTALKMTLSATSIATNADEIVTGSVSPAESGRVITVEAKAPGSSWGEVGRVATDTVGAFALNVPMTSRGDWQVRARVDAKGRRANAETAAQHVKVLDPTQLDVRIPEYARSDKALRIQGRVTPAAARVLHVETSADGHTFTSQGDATSDAATGQFALKVASLAPGNVTIRVVVDNSDTAAGIQSKGQTVKVEDYVAAGKRYLAIVGPGNKARDAFYKSVNTLQAYTSAAAALSRASTREARLLRSYGYWPQEVKPYISIIIKSDTLDADYYNQLAHVKSLAASYDVTEPTYPKGSDNAGALARAAMGLPKRD